MKCRHVSAAQKPDFPSLVDEIAEPRPDENIKVAAFTVCEKSINTMYQIDGKCTQTHQIDKLYKLKNTSKSFKKSENLYNLKYADAVVMKMVRSLHAN